MAQKFDKQMHSRSTVTVKFTTSVTPDAILIDLEGEPGVMAIDGYAIESVTIRESRVITLTPEQYRLRQAAARAAREAKSLVYAGGPDSRD